MNNETIYNNHRLKQDLIFLKIERKKHEVLINLQIQEIYDTIKDPAPYIKRTVKELAGDKDLRSDLVKIGINIAANYVTGKFTGSGSAKGSILSILLKGFEKKQENNKSSDLLNTIINLFSSGKKTNS